MRNPDALIPVGDTTDVTVSTNTLLKMSESPDRQLLFEVFAERVRQEQKWGEQNHPSLDQVLLTREGGCTVARMCEEYEVPTPSRAIFKCETAFKRGEGTWAHILVEELGEVIGAKSEAARRMELIQLAAVCVAWVGSIDRAGRKEDTTDELH